MYRRRPHAVLVASAVLLVHTICFAGSIASQEKLEWLDRSKDIVIIGTVIDIEHDELLSRGNVNRIEKFSKVTVAVLSSLFGSPSDTLAFYALENVSLDENRNALTISETDSPRWFARGDNVLLVLRSFSRQRASNRQPAKFYFVQYVRYIQGAVRPNSPLLVKRYRGFDRDVNYRFLSYADIMDTMEYEYVATPVTLSDWCALNGLTYKGVQ